MKNLTQWFPVIAMVAIDLALALSNILLKKIVTHGIDHLVFITYRQTISTIFLSPLAFFLERKSRPKLTFTILCHLFVSAILGASVTQYLFLLGIQYTSATFSCAFLNVVPVLTFLMALPFGLERVNIRSRCGRAKMMGGIMCVGGAVLLTVYKGMPLFHLSSEQNMKAAGGSSSRWGVGSVALLAGTLCWSSWFLLQTSIGKRYPCLYSSTAILSFFSAIQSAILSISIDRKLSVWIIMKNSDIFILLYAGMIGSGLCFVGMAWCVKKRGPVFTAAFSPLVQIMAAIFDVPLLHEQLHLGSLIGSVTVIAGLYIMLWGKDKEMQNQEKLVVVVSETEDIKEQDIEFSSHKINA
ncbi:hypothetical protein ACS0TY_011238 [Phlomoides rotata]